MPRRPLIATNPQAAIRAALAEWFAAEGRDYPWRRTRDPYAILVSEVMLQQTQIATVLGRGYYQRFMAEFPTVSALAAADDERLLKAWEGLGYYRRARMLRETARVVASQGGGFPCDWDGLLALPGIGRYTAGALRAFAFNLPGAVVDGNVARVLARLHDFRGPVDETAGARRLAAWAAALEDGAEPRVHNAALMELGQVHCRPGEPACGKCPVAAYCRAADPAELPVKSRKTRITAVDEHALWVRDREGRVLLHREDGPRRTGLWKLPVRAAEEVSGLPVLGEWSYAITRYKVRLVLHRAGVRARRAGEEWVEPAALERLPLSAPFRRVVVAMLENIGERE